MQGGAAPVEGRSGASPDKADESAKKARLDLPDGHVKQEVAAAAYSPRVEIAVRIDKQVLHCPLCTLPFKPPVFQCKAGHLACGGCMVQLPFVQCEACVDGGGFFDPCCPAVDAIVSSTWIECPNVGCQWNVTYHEVVEHQKACPHVPCQCTVPGCGYFGAPQALASHLNTVHSVPISIVQYGKVSQLQLSVSTQRVVLLSDDNCVFLLTMGALVASVTTVSVVCARARVATRPRFTCELWVNLEPPTTAVNCGKEDMLLLAMHMRSSSSPGAVGAAGEPTFLTVPPMYMVPAAGDGTSMQVPLHIRIDKLSPWSDASV